MKILLWHGYLLTGSGSNVYAANVARSWRAGGHDVLLLCQERHPESLGFVDEAGTIDGSTMDVEPVDGAPRSGGRCIVARPQIGRILPVYVYDPYEGFAAKLFTDLTDQELHDYVDRNVDALVNAIRIFDPDVIITGHEVMGPAIAGRACELSGARFIAKLHGSALEYAVKKQERYRAYAIEGLTAAARVVGPSRYMVAEAAAHIPGWKDKAVVVNPGCDVDLFRPRRRPEPGVVGYVGKFIASKGVHDLIAAMPLVPESRRAVIVGYGGLDREVRDLAAALSSGDVDAALTIARALDVQRLVAFLEDPPDGYADAARGGEVGFPGRLEHGPLSEVLPTFDVLAVPSVVPEAFGMVAAEAAAAGVLPVVPDHSGIAEAGAAVEDAIGRPGFLTYDAKDPIRDLARALRRVLALPAEEKRAAERAAAALARARWSWDQVADALLSHATEEDRRGA